MNILNTVVWPAIITLMTVVGSFNTSLADTDGKVLSTTEAEVKLDNGVEVELLAVSNWQWMHTWRSHLEASGHAENWNTDLWCVRMVPSGRM